MNLYEEVTDRIIAELEKGEIPWKKPWCGVRSGAISYATGRPYSLLNQFMLKPGEYITFNQCKARGGKIKKGAKSRMVVFWKVIYKEKKDASGQIVTDAEGKPVMEGTPFLRYFNVFHIDDCEGVEPRWQGKLPEAHAKPFEAAEEVLMGYVTREHVTLRHARQDRAFYRPATDEIVLPLMEQFPETAEYYSTAFHEATHSTGHASRLNRLNTGLAAAAFGSDDYSKEELVAEIGSACILNELGIETPASFRNSAAYIQNWLQVLRNDKHMIISAASRAEKAVKMILNITDEKQEQGE